MGRKRSCRRACAGSTTRTDPGRPSASRAAAAAGASAETLDRLPSKMISPSVGSSSRTSVRPSVDLPQPDSPTSPSVSPSRTAKLTSSTACTRATSRCRTPFRIGKYFLTWRTSRSGPCVLTPPPPRRRRSSRHDASRLYVDVEPAAVEVAGGLDAVLEPRLLACTSRTRAGSAAGTCSPRRVDQRRRRAFDRVQTLRPRPVEPRDRAEQAPRVRHLRVVEELALRRRARRRGRRT